MEKPPNQKSNSIKELLWFSLISTSIKLLLIPSYHSTDFEVHRNWLAITHSLPLTQWYFDTTSQWTLDYPPFFAYFELFLSFFASKIDPKIVHLHQGIDYKGIPCLYFQCLSVILSDFVLYFGVYRISRKFKGFKRRLMWVLIVLSPGLLIVDHMHFQYNGFLLGLLLVSISGLIDGNDLMGGVFFAVLLCFKHLFAVAGPVYFVYLFRHYCVGGLVKGLGRLFVLGFAVVAVFVAAFGPFVYYGQILQVIHRMFPFGRGLCHAFWAPNFWVFYIMADKLLAFLLRRVGFDVQIPEGSFTSGLVGNSSPFAVLPQITPLVTFMMVLFAISPCLFKAWKNPQPRKIARWISYAYTCGFLFGWHVHEKAALHFVIPLAVNALDSINDARHYFLLSIGWALGRRTEGEFLAPANRRHLHRSHVAQAKVSCYSLFPLLFEAREYPIKVTLLLLHCLLMWLGFSSIFSGETPTVSKKHSLKNNDELRSDSHLTEISENGRLNIGWIHKSYLLGLIAVEIWGQFLHPLVLGHKFPFLPLMLVSVYCAFGIMYSWIWQLKWIILSS